MLASIFPRTAFATGLCFSVAIALQSQAQPAVTTTKSDSFTADGNGRATPGGTIRYDNIITNSGTSSALGVTFTDPTPANTTLVAGSVNVSPVAINDSYTAVGNTLLRAGGSAGSGPELFVAQGVMGNDREFLGDSATVTQVLTVSTVTSGSITAATPHGSVVMTVADGSFTYLPAAGYTGSDSFTYKLRDDGTDGIAGNADDLSDTATVSITVTGMVWYVNSSLAVNGDGRSSSPFNALVNVNGASDVDAPGQTICLFSGAYAGGLSLENNQVLLGQSHGFFSGATSLFAASGTNPIISGGLVLASGNSLQGVSLGSVSGTALSGSNVGTLVMNTVTPGVINNSTGAAVSINTGVLNMAFSAVSSTGSASAGISLTSCSGTFIASGGALKDATGADVSLSGGSTQFTYDGSITDDLGSLVNISGQTGGTKDFNGAITDGNDGDGSGISLTNNTGATLRFNGGLTLATGANPAFVATGGGTLIVTDPAGAPENTITTTTGTALNVDNTNIGLGGLVFRSIAVNGAANGIVLNATGSTAGLSVTGNGSANSGGTLQNTTGTSIVATDTQDLTLFRIIITNPGNHGIDAANLRGTCLLSDSSINDWTTANGNGLNLINNNANLTKLTLTGCAFNGSATSNAGVLMEAQGNSSMELSIEGSSTFTDLFGDAVHVSSITGASGTVKTTIKNSTFNTAAANGNGGILMTPFGGPSTFTFNIENNSFDTLMRPLTTLGVISVTNGDLDGSGPSLNGTIKGNTLNNIIGSRGISATCDTFSGPTKLLISGNSIDRLGSTSKHGISVNFLNSAAGEVSVIDNRLGQAAPFWTSGVGNGNPVLLTTQNTAVMTALLSGNVVSANTNSVIEVMRVRGIGSSTLNATVSGNTLTDTDGTHVEFDASTGTGAVVGGTINLNISGNTLPAGGVIKLTRNASPGDINVTQASAASVASSNSGATVTLTGAPDFGQATPALPNSPPLPLLFAANMEEILPVALARETTSHASLLASPPASPARETLTRDQLDLLVAEAVARWEATGLTPEQSRILHDLHFEISDLATLHLGQAAGNSIQISAHAADQQWFIDPTPSDDDEFSRVAVATRRSSQNGDAGAGRVDLLSTLIHEMGHTLGLPDCYDLSQRDNVMFGYLGTGERRLPAKAEANRAKALSEITPRFLTAPITIGDLPAGKSVTVVYSVTINSATTAATVTSQASVSGSNFSDVLSNSRITPVEQPPVLSVIARNVDEDTPLVFGITSFDSGFNDGNGDVLTSVRITELPTNGVLKLSGSAISSVPLDIPRANLANLSFVPITDFSGSTNFAWNASDGVSYAASTSLVNITVAAVNDPPTLLAISDPAAILEDAGPQSINLTGITAGGGESQILTVTAVSGNSALIANPTVTYSSPDSTGSLSYTPIANQSGSALITVSVADNGSGLLTQQRTFTVNVTAVNDSPTLDAISDPAAIPVGSAKQTINFAGVSEGPLEAAQTLAITAVSSNPSLIPNPSIAFTEGDATGSLAYTPVSGKSGTALITVTVTDSGDTANGGIKSVQKTFSVTVYPSFSILADAAIEAEGSGLGSTPLTFTVARTGNTTADVVLDYAVTGSGLNPANAADFGGALPAGTVTILAGQASATLTLNIAKDSTVELDENFTVTLSDPNAGVITSPTAVGTILNDDSSVVSLAAADVNEGDSGSAELVFTISLTHPVDVALTLDRATLATGSATVGTDFIALPVASLTIPAGEITATFGVAVVGDNDVEPDETVAASLSNLVTNSRSVTLGTTSATGTILNDDPLLVAATGSLAVKTGTSAKLKIADLLALTSPVEGRAVNLVSVQSLPTAAGGSVVIAGTWISYQAPAGYAGLDSFVYTISDGVQTVSGTVAVSIATQSGTTPNVYRLTDEGIGKRLLSLGIPGRRYQLQTSSDLVAWTPLGAVVLCPTAGAVSFLDPGPLPPKRFYRVVEATTP
jgi:uncharacterized repeat protein (TIGR01451 family)